MSGVSHELAALGWPGARLEEAVGVLARVTGLAAPGQRRPLTTFDALESELDATLEQRLDRATRRMGLEALAVETTYADMRELIARAGPAVVRVPALIPDEPLDEVSSVEPYFLLLLPSRRGKARVIATDGAVRRVDPGCMVDALCGPMLAHHAEFVDRTLADLHVRERRRARVRESLLVAQFGRMRLDACWLLRATTSSSFWGQARELGLGSALAVLFGAHAAEYGLLILGWALLGRGALEGRLDLGWLWAWALALAAIVGLRMAQTAAQGKLGVGVGCALKQRLFDGALQLDPDVLRRDGVGQLLGRLFEAEAVEALALTGALIGLPSLIDLVAAAVIVSLGLAGNLLLLAILGWVVVLAVVARCYLKRLAAWTDVRLELTHDLVEKMVGHRTRMAQVERRHLHQGEDERFETYLERGRALDQTAALLGVLPRAWLILGLLGVGAAFISSEASPASVGVTLGGMLLAHGAFERLEGAITSLGRAVVSWSKVVPLFRPALAATSPAGAGVGVLAREDGAESGLDAPLLDAMGLVFRYTALQRPVLRGCTLSIRRGDRVLIEGASGSGKSTLAAILAGLRPAESGLLLLGGLDRHTLGAQAWRQSCTVTPQFHENHVLTETFAFNLLMGRSWPPSEHDLAEAASVCDELGLSELVGRMPNGLAQMLGETGWQLSQGERSRLFIARALLQKAPLLIFDESFGSLDPETALRVFACVERRAKTLIVIAHP